MTNTLIVEGWRFIPHSYAIVNQWQLLALARRGDIRVKVVDLPFLGRQWQTQLGLFNSEEEQILRSFDIAKPEECADITLRMSASFDFSRSASVQTAIFGTSESQVLRKDQFPDFQAFTDFQRSPPPENVKIVTPSRWSAKGFYKAGFKAEQVLIVPHGVDVATFHRMPDRRRQIRETMSVADDEFVFLSVGAMTGNKGIDVLLKAFAEVYRKFPQARLILKGLDSLYGSQQFLLKNMQTIPSGDRQRIVDRIHYLGNPMPFRSMAMLYQAADTYVSPYRAEGFNLPVLESAACGLPIICTGGGSTDDFTTDAFARRIESEQLSKRFNDQDLVRLEPNTEHLITLMISAIEDNAWRKRAAEAGPSHVQKNYTWDCVVNMLVRKLWNSDLTPVGVTWS